MVAALRAVSNKPVTLGGLIDALDDARKVKQAIAIKEKEAAKVYTELESQIIALLDENETTRGGGKKATASISEEEIYQFDDFDTFAAYAKKNNLLHLFQRRLSAPAVREVAEKRKGGLIPGLSVFKKRKLSLHSL